MLTACYIVMSKFKHCSNICSFALLLIAVMVAFGLREGRDMQRWIVVYWAMLALKNLIDWHGGTKDDKT